MCSTIYKLFRFIKGAQHMYACTNPEINERGYSTGVLGGVLQKILRFSCEILVQSEA